MAGDAPASEPAAPRDGSRSAQAREASLAAVFAALAAAPREHDFFAILRHVEPGCTEQPQLPGKLANEPFPSRVEIVCHDGAGSFAGERGR